MENIRPKALARKKARALFDEYLETGSSHELGKYIQDVKQRKNTIKDYKLTYYDKKKMSNLEVAVKVLSDFYYNVTHEGESHDKTRRSNKK